MGNENTVLTIGDARHLLRRTGFGAPLDRLSRYTGMTRGKAADKLLRFTPSGFRPRGKDEAAIKDSWIKQMVRCRHPLQEKLVLFWHDHFATAIDKVRSAGLMADQNKLLRKFCKGNFKNLVKAMNRDCALIYFLDTTQNHQEVPNENYARELQEIFTLGVTDLNGQPNYEQADIVQIARAFTGWTFEKGDNKALMNNWDHDYSIDWPERGPKVIYQTRGGFGPAGRDFTQPEGEGAVEIDQVTDIIFEHRDSDGASTVARHIARKMLQYFAHATPTKAEVDAVISLSGFDVTWNIAALVRAIIVSDIFYATAPGPDYGPSSLKSVRWPIDYVISTLRVLKMKPAGRGQYINYSSLAPVRNYLSSMGQDLFTPPSVFGWTWELGWLSTSALLSRYALAVDLVSARGVGPTAFRPERLKPIRVLMRSGPAAAESIVDAVTDILGVTDQLTDTERDILVAYLGGSGVQLNLNTDSVRNTKLHGLFALVLQSVAYHLQ